MQVINETNPGGALGAAFGQGLAALAQSKMQQMQGKQSQDKTFQALKALGAPDEEASAMAMMPEKLQEKIFPNYITALARQRSEQPQEQQMQQPQNGLAALQGQAQAAPMQEISPMEPKAGLANIPTAQQNAQQFTKQIGVGKGAEVLNQVMQQAQQPQVQPQQETPIQQATQQIEKTVTPKVKKVSALAATTPKEKLELFKYSKAERKEILEGEKAANDSIRTLDRMEELNKGGKLINPILYKGLTKLGLDIQGLMNADTQEFEKLTTEFLKGMKSIFGARVSNVEMQQFVKGIPSLIQTPSGREAVIRNMRTVAQGAKIKANAMRDIMKENGGTPPLDLEERISERIDPQMNELSDNFRQGIEAPKAGDRLTSLPPAASFATGSIITNKKTGQRMKSDGSKWVKV
jgi:hypothetical protein